ncbi:hypothetical protein EVAR_76271_1 [Eumeta japonica]|uniref:Uncharacterized protein n=1 Tax=Eumeta variegata TaxID=151549 RepID=A0A4C1UQB6_EUMVA|nr:hypothetical protein EVAR_76271_1 [Eumeta japonica]
MKPYLRANKAFMVQLRSSTGIARAYLLTREFGRDVAALWRYGAPFPTFLKILATLMLCLVVLMPLTYPLFVVVLTYFTYESLILSWLHDSPHLFCPEQIMRRTFQAVWRPCAPERLREVRKVLTRAILVTHSLATSIDYLCVVQGLLDDIIM